MAVNRAADEPVFGLWLARRRRILDFTQAELAKRVGCSESTIRKLEADQRRPSKRVATMLASVLQVPDAETAAFVAFARSGWSDRPPAAWPPGPGLPWPGNGDLSAALPAASPPGASSLLAGHSMTADAEAPPAMRGVGWPFVARHREIARLDAALDVALTGRGQVRLISGEAGQGKTALLTAFAQRARQAHPDLVTASGSCNAYTGSGDPFLPFRVILEQLTTPVAWGRDGEAPTNLTKGPLRGKVAFVVVETLLRHGPHLLDALVPAASLARLADAGFLPAELVSSLQSKGPLSLRRIAGAPGEHALCQEATTVLTRVSRHAPLLLLLDDMQWADRSSLDLLLHLARSAAQSPMLVLVAYRPPNVSIEQSDAGFPLRQLTREIARLFEDVVIDLDLADGRAFLDAWLDSRPNRLGSEFRAALLRQTGGQPLFTIELLRAMQQREELILDAAGRWVSVPDVRWDALPARVSGALAERIERLDAPCRTLLRVAAVEGEGFTAEVAARVLGEDPATIAGLTSRLDRDQRLIVATGVTRVATGVLSCFRFRHNLIQRYVYDDLGESERVYLHERVGAAIESLFGDDVDPLAVALHYRRAHAPGRAARFQRLAGDRAATSGALAQAIAHYQQAVAHWPDDDLDSRAGLLRDLGTCQFDHGMLEDAEKTLKAAHTAFQALGDVRAAGAVETALGRTYHERGDHARGLEACRRAVLALEGERETVELAMALVLTAGLNLMASQYAPALDLGNRALEMADRLHADGVRSGALSVVGAALASIGSAHRDEGFAMLEEAHELGDRVGAVQFAADAIAKSGLRLLAVDRFARARHQFHRTRTYARMRQIGLVEAWAAYGLWLLDWRRGDWRRALRRLPSVQKLAGGSGEWSRGSSRLQVVLASMDIDLGRVEDAAARLDAHEPWLSHNTMEHGKAPYLRERLRVAVALGGEREADGIVNRLHDMLGERPTHSDKVMAPLLTAVRWLARHRQAGAAHTATAFVTVLEQARQQYGSATASATAAEACGTVAEMTGDTHAACTYYLEAARLWANVGFPLDEVRAQGLAAHALAKLGREGEAASARRRGEALMTALSAQLPSQALVRTFHDQARLLLENPRCALP